VRTGLDLNIFVKLDEDNGVAKSSSELAKMTGADPVLMGGSPQAKNVQMVEYADSLSRPIIEASSSNGSNLRIRIK